MPVFRTYNSIIISGLGQTLYSVLAIWTGLSNLLGGFPDGASGKEPAWQCRRRKRRRFNPWLRKTPWRRKLQPALVFWPGESHGQRESLVDDSPWSCSRTQPKRFNMQHRNLTPGHIVAVFSHSVVPSSFRPHGLQHSRLPCPSPSPEACSNSCPLSWWCHPTISSSTVPFCFQSFPASVSSV